MFHRPAAKPVRYADDRPITDGDDYRDEDKDVSHRRYSISARRASSEGDDDDSVGSGEEDDNESDGDDDDGDDSTEVGKRRKRKSDSARGSNRASKVPGKPKGGDNSKDKYGGGSAGTGKVSVYVDCIFVLVMLLSYVGHFTDLLLLLIF